MWLRDGAPRLAARRVQARAVARDVLAREPAMLIAQAGARITGWLAGGPVCDADARPAIAREVDEVVEALAQWRRRGTLAPVLRVLDGVAAMEAARGDRVAAADLRHWARLACALKGAGDGEDRLWLYP